MSELLFCSSAPRKASNESKKRKESREGGEGKRAAAVGFKQKPTKVNNQSERMTQIFKSEMQRLCSEGNLNPVDCVADQSIALIVSCEHSFALRPSFPGFTLRFNARPECLRSSV